MRLYGILRSVLDLITMLMVMIARASFVRAGRTTLLTIVLAALGAGVGAASASAMTREASCSNLQTTINEVAGEIKHGEGDVIVLKGMCDAAYTLPSGAAFTLEGAPGHEVFVDPEIGRRAQLPIQRMLDFAREHLPTFRGSGDA